MAFKDRLKEARLSNGLTQEQVAERIGVAKSTFTGYEKGNSEPNMFTISQIMKALNVDANYLWQDEMDALGGNPMQLKYNEMEHIKKYRALDTPGQNAVDWMIDHETARVAAINKLRNHPVTIIEFDGQSDTPARYIQYYQKVSAGTGEVIYEDTPPERITIPDIPQYRRVAYAVKVSGHSMEPLYNDGDMLLIEPACVVDVGEIGIFNVDGKAYVKKRGETELISLNKGYGNVPLTSESRCMGRVVDKYVVD